MALSKPKDSLFDPYRGSFVAATPEEQVRQRLLHLMTEKLGYPKHFLCVEKKLSELPHLEKGGNLPNRRADILCLSADLHPEYPLYPLLLIECKGELIGESAKKQALGYNHHVKAFFVAVAGSGGVELVYPYSLSFLPSYLQLKEHICK
jgi:hypothetical protein